MHSLNKLQTKIDLNPFHTRSKVTSIHNFVVVFFIFDWSMYSLTDMCGLVNYNMNQLQWAFTRNEVNNENQPMSMYTIFM